MPQNRAKRESVAALNRVDSASDSVVFRGHRAGVPLLFRVPSSRSLFYNTVMPVDRKVTVKMERKKEEELRLDALEKRRNLRRYQLGSGQRHFHVWLDSGALGLSGKLDLLIVSAKGYFPVDFKYTRGRPHRNHVFQLAGYGLLVEENFRTQVG